MISNCVLSDLIDFSRDGEWGESEPFDGSVRMAAIRGTDFDAIRQGNLSTVPVRFVKEHTARYKTLHGGEIIIEAAGGSKGRITGRTIYLKPDTVSRFGIPVTCASFSRFIRLKESESWDTRYVFWQLQYLYHFGFMDKYHTQHTGVSRFQWGVFADNEHLILPPLPAQRKIASILSAYDDLIENNLRRIKILEEMAQNLYREWFVKFRFPGHQPVHFTDSHIGPIPEDWEVDAVANTFAVLGGGTPSKAVPAYWDTGTINWYSPTDLTASNSMFVERSGSQITELGLKESSARLFPPFSVMMTSRATLGVISINTTEACTNQGFITCVPSERFPLYTLFFWLKENVEYFISLGTGATFKEITKGVFKTVKLAVPPKAVATRFEEAVQQFAFQILNLQRRNAALRRTRDLLLPHLISGEVDVSELDISVPEEAGA